MVFLKVFCGENPFNRPSMEKKPLEGLLLKEALWLVFYEEKIFEKSSMERNLLKVLNDRSFEGLLRRRPSTGLLWRDRPCGGLLWKENTL